MIRARVRKSRGRQRPRAMLLIELLGALATLALATVLIGAMLLDGLYFLQLANAEGARASLRPSLLRSVRDRALEADACAWDQARATLRLIRGLTTTEYRFERDAVVELEAGRERTRWATERLSFAATLQQGPRALLRIEFTEEAPARKLARRPRVFDAAVLLPPLVSAAGSPP